MRKLVWALVFSVAVGVSALFPAVAFADNPAGAPADQIGTAVAEIAQTTPNNFGQDVCKPGALTQTEDDGTLAFLGLTPPGNAP